jgi:hypothetical protein
MAQPSVKEKKHLKERIRRKVDQTNELILTKQDGHYLARVSQESHELAIDSLGMREMQAQAEERENREMSLREERQGLYKAMVVKVTGRRLSELPAAYYSFPPEIDRRAAQHEQELMEKDDLGRRSWRCAAKEQMLDTVWLATSGKHIRELWSSVTELPQDSPTPLQAKALSIEPDPGLE